MMKICEWHNCTQWGQWRVSWPDKTVRLLCWTHKMATKDSDPESEKLKFIFAGVVPDGIEHS